MKNTKAYPENTPNEECIWKWMHIFGESPRTSVHYMTVLHSHIHFI